MPDVPVPFPCTCGALAADAWTHSSQCPFALAALLAAEIDRQDAYGRYGAPLGTPLGISRLALASLEDETAEALASWRDERGDITWASTRAEVLQVAAVAFRVLRDALPSPRP